jgi:transposase
LEAKYGKYVRCDYCNSDRIYIHYKGKNVYRCRRCWGIFSLTSNTYVHRSRSSLRFWYEILWCFVLSHSANKAHKLLGTTRHQQILFPYHTIRRALVDYSDATWEKEKGVYEADEALYGGKWENLRKRAKALLCEQGQNKRGRGAKERKQPVFGIYKRNGGKVYLRLIDDFEADTLEAIIAEIADKESEIFSDAWKGYNGLVGLGYAHSRVAHGKGEYVSGKVHVNGMEGFWGLSKTNMNTYKGIRKRNWEYYLKEMEFRYNYRDLTFAQQVNKLVEIIMRKPNYAE